MNFVNINVVKLQNSTLILSKDIEKLEFDKKKAAHYVPITFGHS